MFFVHAQRGGRSTQFKIAVHFNESCRANLYQNPYFYVTSGELGHFAPNFFAKIVYRTLMGDAKGEQDFTFCESGKW